MSKLTDKIIIIDLINSPDLKKFPCTTTIPNGVSHIEAMRWCSDNIGDHNNQWAFDIDGSISFTNNDDLIWFKVAWS